jgi:hypothetical protein
MEKDKKMKTKTSTEKTPTARLMFSHLADPTTPTPTTIEAIASAIGSPIGTVRVYIGKFVREGYVIRTLIGHTAHFQLTPSDIKTTRTEVSIPGTKRTYTKLSYVVPDSASAPSA